ncbi:phytanoyl-CoA dioxygenase family protein [Propionibacteriaceae bacterium Y2011]|uniref:phytanoyl-CoA dioxygenase family protein n=1 Tax=Microlunatus sp. Y2014 TaxID=3418488 RepID=UPI003B4E3B79
MSALVDRKHLLTSVEMAQFVASGAVRLDGVVPAALNDRAIDVFDAGIEHHPYGTDLDTAYPPGSFVRDLVDLPAVAGAIQSLVGPRPRIDHHAVHIRPPHGGTAQPMHGDAVIDTRYEGFDVQLMYYPREVTLAQGGTLSVPGTHLRRINESSIGRYQNLRGQTRLVCPAGTVVFLHHGIWHGGRRNDSDVARYMFKIRFNPTVRQVRLWNTDDIDSPEVMAALKQHTEWASNAETRLEYVNRARLWRSLTADPLFDIDYYLSREEMRPTTIAPGATDPRLGASGTGTGWGM